MLLKGKNNWEDVTYKNFIKNIFILF
jgi:hypothetical protein